MDALYRIFASDVVIPVGVTDSGFLIIDGAKLEFRRWPGGRQPILLLHEGLGSLAMWKDFPEKLVASCGSEVIAWSRRGYGRSDPLPGPRRADYMHREADLLPDLLDQLGIDRAHFYGHSDGASIALIAASKFPERVAGLILEAPHVFVETVTLDGIREAKRLFQTTDLPSRLSRYHDDPNHAFWSWNDIWLDERFRNWNIEDCLPDIKAPALLIQGADDAYGTLEQLDRISRILTSTDRLILEGCAHSPHREKTEAVIEAAQGFVRSVDHGESATLFSE